MDGPDDDDGDEAAGAVFGDVVLEEPYIGSLCSGTLKGNGSKGERKETTFFLHNLSLASPIVTRHYPRASGMYNSKSMSDM